MTRYAVDVPAGLRGKSARFVGLGALGGAPSMADLQALAAVDPGRLEGLYPGTAEAFRAVKGKMLEAYRRATRKKSKGGERKASKPAAGWPIYHRLSVRVVEDAEAVTTREKGLRGLVFLAALLLGALALWVAPSPEEDGSEES